VKNAEARLGGGCYAQTEDGIGYAKLVPMSLDATEMSENE